mgnify:CR=1 FL=1
MEVLRVATSGTAAGGRVVREAGAARVRAVMVRVRGAVTRVGVVGEVEKENQGVVATAMVADGGGAWPGSNLARCP